MNTTAPDRDETMHGPYMGEPSQLPPSESHAVQDARVADPAWAAAHKPAPKRVLITGAGGAIGVHMLAHILEHTDWNVVAIDSFKTDHKGYIDRLSELMGKYAGEWPVYKRLKVVAHDLCAPFTEREIERLGDIDYIVNLASRSDVQSSIDDPLPFVRNNTELMLNVLELARAVAPHKFIQFSTDEVYGPAERDSGGHKEWEAILPSNPYAASKAAQEAFAIAWWRSFGVPVIITNTMNNFGEMQAPSKFPAMIQKRIEAGQPIDLHISADGEMGTRYYLHSRNAADAVLFILKEIEPQQHGAGEIDRPLRFNIVGDKQLTNKELVDAIAALMGKEAITREVRFHERNPGHDLHYGLNGDALKDAGWTSPESFEDSMARTIDWQRKHPNWMK